MKTFKPMKLSVLTRTHEHERQYRLAVTVMAFFSFDDPRALIADAALWPFVATQLGARPVLDDGMPKARGEVVLCARAYPVGRRPAAAVAPRVKLGTVDKSLVVVGDRRWEAGWVTEPEPFLEMPIDWEHAFGGKGYAPNPVGKGHAGPRARPLHLPNVESARDRVTAPGDAPAPAGFAALDLSWPQRMSKAGTYDAAWQRTLMPGYAADIDWTIFNVAPPDQWLDGYFRGDERFELDNMHPDKPRIAGALPGLRARVFLNQRRLDGALALRDLETRLDTVLLVPHEERGVLIYRAVARVAEDDAADVAHLMVACELAAAPRPRAHYEAALVARLDRAGRAMASLRDEDLLHPEAAAGGLATAAGPPAVPRPESLKTRNLRRRGALEREKMQQRLSALGLDPAMASALVPAPESPAGDDDGEAREAREDPAAAIAKARAQMADVVAQRRKALTELRATLGAHGIDPAVAVAKAAATGGGPPKLKAAEQLAKLHAIRDGLAAMGQSTAALDAKLNDPELAANLRAAEARLAGVYRRRAQHFPPAAGCTPADSARLRAELVAARARGESLAERDLTGVDLAGADLAGADLRRALLEGADLSRANLAGADLTDAVLTRANLTDADLTGARLDGANLGGATLRGTRLGGGTTLRGAVLEKAVLAGADLTGADLTGASVLESQLAGATLAGVVLPKALFRRCTFAGTSLRGADLSGATFLESDLAGADLRDAVLTGATFLRCPCERLDLSGARADNVRFASECGLADARFVGASLAAANFRAMDLSRADFTGAGLEKADFTRARLVGARFHRARAAEARFASADLTDADMVAIDLRHGILQKATIHGLRLTGANLFRADFGKVRGGARDMSDALVIDVRVTPRRT